MQALRKIKRILGILKFTLPNKILAKSLPLITMKKKKAKKKVNKKNKYVRWITPGFIIFLIGLQAYSYFVNTPKFKTENIKITVAELYNVDIVKGTVYSDFVYKVGDKLYKSGTGGGNGGEFRKWKSPEFRKYPVIYNVDNPKINFLLPKHRLSDSLQIGTELENIYFDNKSMKRRLMTQTVQKAYVEAKYLKEYINLKKMNNKW